MLCAGVVVGRVFRTSDARLRGDARGRDGGILEESRVRRRRQQRLL